MATNNKVRREKSGTMKVAKLITVTLTTRIIVKEGADDCLIFELAERQLQDKLREEASQNITEVKDDTECPFGTFETDKTAKWSYYSQDSKQ